MRLDVIPILCIHSADDPVQTLVLLHDDIIIQPAAWLFLLQLRIDTRPVHPEQQIRPIENFLFRTRLCQDPQDIVILCRRNHPNQRADIRRAIRIGQLIRQQAACPEKRHTHLHAP